jgi:hypothetical protein
VLPGRVVAEQERCRFIFDRGRKDLRSSFPGLYSGPQPPFPLSSRPERSAVERTAVFVPWTLLRTTTALPFVISTGARRSGEICGLRSLDSTPDHNRPSLCHLDRSVAQWRDLRSSSPELNSGPQPPFPLSSRPERSAVERSAVQRSFHGQMFLREAQPGDLPSLFPPTLYNEECPPCELFRRSVPMTARTPALFS